MVDNLLTEDHQPVIDPNKDYTTELVGEGKKFKTVQDLARGKYESDLYIKSLERAQDELRADYKRVHEENIARDKLQAYLDRLDAREQQSSSENTQTANDVQNRHAYDPKEIESLVSTKIQEAEATRRQQENYKLSRNKLVERYGDNYQGVFKQQIESLGLDETFVNDLARNHPTVFSKTFGLDQPAQREGFQAPPGSSIRQGNFAPKEEKRTWQFYQNMKKNNPDLYHSPKTTVQMHNDAIALGDEFKDGDYNAY